MYGKNFFISNGDLYEVNKVLKNGGKVKMISAVSRPIVGGGDAICCDKSDVCSCVVVEMPFELELEESLEDIMRHM